MKTIKVKDLPAEIREEIYRRRKAQKLMRVTSPKGWDKTS